MENNKKIKPFCLVVLDGFGISVRFSGNAITQAKTPFFDKLWNESPRTLLVASGEAVGLPHGQVGNSEVGHINMGAGRIVPQELTKINEAIENKTFFRNPVLLSAIKTAKAKKSKIHLMGSFSDGGVHADFKHFFPLLSMIKKNGYEGEVFIHAFTDGRDVAPYSARKYLKDFEEKTQEIGLGKIATIVGRSYSMDRAGRWGRIQKVYELLCEGKGRKMKNPVDAIREDYQHGLNDQLIKPTVIVKDGKPIGILNDADVIIFINLRSERARQLSRPFVMTDFDKFKRNKVLNDIFFIGMTNFGDDLPMSVAYPEFPLKNTLPEVLSSYDLKQFYIAEEEKFAHVTYFFHGGSAIKFPGEERVMVGSIEVEDFSKAPRMSSQEVFGIYQERIKAGKEHFLMVNFPNPDMVAHTGNLKATIGAIECLDHCLYGLCQTVKKMDGILVVTSDHGNAESMIDPETSAILTEHSPNPVPFIIFNGPKNLPLREGVLGDVAPTILDLMEIHKPRDMTQDTLII